MGFAGIGFAVLVAAFGVWLMQASDRVVGFAAQRNEHVTRIVADTLAGWPGTIASMARSNFLPQRIEPAAPDDARRGWQAQARFWHPDLGRFAIRYAVVDAKATCPQADAMGRRAWFTADTMELGDSLDMAQLEALDRQLLPDLSRDYRAWLTAPRGERPQVVLGPGDRLCYAASLGLTRLVPLDNGVIVLIADARDEVAARIGDDPPPISGLSRLPLTQSITASLLGGVSKQPLPAARGFDGLDPVRTRIGGSDYIAYTREIALPGSDTAMPQRFRAVALVPAGRLLGRLPPIVVAAFGIPLLLLMSMTMVIKLRLIGPGEALHRLEIAALGLGAIGAVALVTAAILFAVDAQASRARAGQLTSQTADALRKQFAAEVAPLLVPLSEPLGKDGAAVTADAKGRWWDPAACENTLLPLTSPLSAPDPGYPLIERPRHAFRSPALPARESVFVVGRDGLQLPGTAISACRSNVGGRLDVSRRGYFGRAVEDNTLPVPGVTEWLRLQPPTGIAGAGRTLLIAPRYTVEQVRSQSDGIDKTLFAFPAMRPREGKLRGANAVLVSTAVLRSLLAPVLPPTESFMVVDLDTPGLEMVFHSDRQRIHIEGARREIQTPRLDAVVAALRADKAGAGKPVALTGVYDGVRQHFEFVRLPYTNWALATWHSHDSADEIPALVLSSGLRTLAVSMALVLGLPLLALWLCGRLRWQWLWPDPVRAAVYPRATRDFAAITLVGGFLLLLPVPPVAVALLCWLTAIVVVVVLVGLPAAERGPLGLTMQRDYRRAVVAALAAVVVVPMLAMHADAAHFGSRVVDLGASATLEAGLAARRTATASIANVYFSDPGGARIRDGGDAGAIGVVAACWRPLTEVEARPGLAERVYRFLYTGPPPRAVAATPNILRLPCDAEKLTLGQAVTFDRPVLEWASGSTVRVVWVLLVLGIGIAVLSFTLGGIFRHLFGLATPLEAVTYPPLAHSDDFAALVLPSKVMIIRPPLGLHQQLFANGHRIDLSGETLVQVAGAGIGKAWDAPHHYILYNLELTLREPERRRAALRYMEGLADRADVRDGSATLVLVSELTPLERLLQAYEHEKIGALDAAAGELESIRRQREDIRWAKLLEGFQTYIFSHVDKLDNVRRDGESDVEFAVVRELAALPERVIQTLLPYGATVAAATTMRSVAEFDAVYRGPVLEFARSLKAASPQAAIDFIGLMLIEHYQQLWSASSRPEQLVLYNLSLRRLPSIAARDPLKSLIRRALIRFDPVPRLMNQSFATFVEHAERPQTLRRWRTEAPRGGWRFAAWPLLVILPLGLLALGYAILDSSQTLLALFPLLLATGPAQLQTLGVFKKAST